MSISLRANADGSGTLLNGATPVMEVSAAGVVSLPNIAAGSSANQPVNFGQVIGIGQTWQDVTASRSAGVTYTNTTGKPIFVSVESWSSSSMVTYFYINNIYASSFRFDSSVVPDGNCVGIVPNNSTYKYTTNGTLAKWCELR